MVHTSRLYRFIYGVPKTTDRGDYWESSRTRVVKSHARYAAPTERIALVRDRLYEAYASQRAGTEGGGTAALFYRRFIRPVLPPPSAGCLLDIGCGQGQLLRLLLADGSDGYEAEGVDVSPEQVALGHSSSAQAPQCCLWPSQPVPKLTVLPPASSGTLQPHARQPSTTSSATPDAPHDQADTAANLTQPN